ncbi:MAG: iclR [Ramlibacter sp.]|nr:iclR [Ramlibacter sp.]
MPPKYREHAGDSQFATTLARGIQVLGCFSAEEPVLGVSELMQRSGLPKATVSRLAYTLLRLGLLDTDESQRKYVLGAAVLSLGYPLLASLPLRQIARPMMQQLSDYSKGSVSMGTRAGLDMVYLETSRSRSIVALQTSDIGMSNPILTTSIGRAYLAACTPRQRENVLNQAKIKSPEQWASCERALADNLRRFATRGFCISREDNRQGVAAVGVPFPHPVRGQILCFNCVVHSNTIGRTELESDLGPRLVEMVRRLSEK